MLLLPGRFPPLATGPVPSSHPEMQAQADRLKHLAIGCCSPVARFSRRRVTFATGPVCIASIREIYYYAPLNWYATVIPLRTHPIPSELGS